jgi:RNA ligase (TIGR02306 family)
VTDALNVTKWEMQVPAELAGICKGNFPSFIPKTDEPRLQSFPALVTEVRGKRMRGTLKMDGTSLTTFARGDTFGVCSRNMELVESTGNAYWRMVRELGLTERMPRGYGLQGELTGPSIQGNRIGLTKPTFYAFSLYDFAKNRYWSHAKLEVFSAELGINVVPTVFDGIIDPNWGVEDFLDFANKQVYQNGLPAEGVVWRPYEETYSDVLNGRLSFKTVSDVYLNRYKE